MYRYIFINAPWSLNYVVYRHLDGSPDADVARRAHTHGEATFVLESEAAEYCAWKNGTDEFSQVKRQRDDLIAMVEAHAEVFEKYADIHKAKLTACKQDDAYYQDAEAKWQRNNILAVNARDLLERTREK